MARGRDAADVALTTTFGVNTLRSFQVWTDEVPADATGSANALSRWARTSAIRVGDYRLVSRQ